MKRTHDKAAASAGAADLLYERFEGRIRARFADPDVARDVVTLGGQPLRRPRDRVGRAELAAERVERGGEPGCPA